MSTTHPRLEHPLPPAFAHAIVADAMRHGIVSARPDASASAVARMMAGHHIHAVVVAGVRHGLPGGERLSWGVIGAADLLGAAVGGRFGSLTAGDLVGTPPLVVGPDMSLEAAARAMADARADHVVVVDSDYPVGVLSVLDIAVVLAWGRG